MAGLGGSTLQRLEEDDTSALSADERVAAARARHQRQLAIMHGSADAGFLLGEDAPQNMQGRLEQEKKWKGATVDGRAHFSIRELLRVQKPAIMNALVDFVRVTTLTKGLEIVPRERDEGSASAHGGQADHGLPREIARLTPELLELVVNHAMPGQGPLVSALLSPSLRLQLPGLSNFRIFVRVRPLLEAEVEGGEYAALDDHDSRKLVCHDARLARSGRRLSMIHHWYSVDSVFGQRTPEGSVCDGVIEPLLRRAMGGEGDGTALLYGQTGAGKTYTLSSLLERIAQRLDDEAVTGKVTHGALGGGTGGENKENGSAEGAVARVCFFEIASKGCMDLLNDRAKVCTRRTMHMHMAMHVRCAPRPCPCPCTCQGAHEADAPMHVRCAPWMHAGHTRTHARTLRIRLGPRRRWCFGRTRTTWSMRAAQCRPR